MEEHLNAVSLLSKRGDDGVLPESDPDAMAIAPSGTVTDGAVRDTDTGKEGSLPTGATWPMGVRTAVQGVA